MCTHVCSCRTPIDLTGLTCAPLHLFACSVKVQSRTPVQARATRVVVACQATQNRRQALGLAAAALAAVLVPSAKADLVGAADGAAGGRRWAQGKAPASLQAGAVGLRPRSSAWYRKRRPSAAELRV